MLPDYVKRKSTLNWLNENETNSPTLVRCR